MLNFHGVMNNPLLSMLEVMAEAQKVTTKKFLSNYT